MFSGEGWAGGGVGRVVWGGGVLHPFLFFALTFDHLPLVGAAPCPREWAAPAPCRGVPRPSGV